MDRNKVVVLLGLAGFIAMADNWVVSPILPSISGQLGIAVEQAGLLIAAYMVPFGIFQIIFGPLADRYGKKQVITFSIIMFTIATGLCALGRGLIDLAFYRALTGVFAASIMPISLALIGDIFPIHERQTAIGTFMGIAFLGQGLSMISGGAIAYLLDWRGVFAVYAVLSIIPAIMLLKYYRAIPSVRQNQGSIWTHYGKLLTDSKSFFTYILVLLEGIFIIGSFSYLGAYIAATYDFNQLAIGAIMTAFGAMALAGGRMVGRVVIKIGARMLLSIGLVCALLADAMIYFKGEVLGAFILSVGLLGLGFIFTHSTLLTRATQFARQARGAAMSLVAFCFMGGGGVGTAIGGKLIAVYGISSLFLLYGIGLAITFLMSYLLIQGSVLAGETAAQPAEIKPSVELSS
jgi:predicted MFS family arabinose efflux permease